MRCTGWSIQSTKTLVSTDCGGSLVPSLLPVTLIRTKVKLKENVIKLVCLGQKFPWQLKAPTTQFCLPPMSLRVNAVFCRENKCGVDSVFFVKPCQRLAVWGRWRWPSSCYIQAPTLAVALISGNWQRGSLRMWEVTPEQDPAAFVSMSSASLRSAIEGRVRLGCDWIGFTSSK